MAAPIEHHLRCPVAIRRLQGKLRFRRKQLTRDYIHPTSRGAEDVWTYVGSTCRSCNFKKDNSLPSELGWQFLAVPFEPNPFEWQAIARDRIQGVAFDYLADHFKHLDELRAA